MVLGSVVPVLPADSATARRPCAVDMLAVTGIPWWNKVAAIR
jgi:hypothetical protein